MFQCFLNFLKASIMELKALDWDSTFWNIPIYSLTLEAEDNWEKVVHMVNESGAALVYLFLPVNADFSELINTNHKIVLKDEKLTYGMGISTLSGQTDDAVVEFVGNPDKEFFELARAAGLFSRFKIDDRLSHKFNELYDLWLLNSVNQSIADKVFIYKDVDNSIAAFLTASIKNQTGTIGLIATKENQRGKGIGQKLINHLHDWYLTKKINYSTVVTQKKNIGACHFYEKIGFKLIKEELVYHWWVK